MTHKIDMNKWFETEGIKDIWSILDSQRDKILMNWDIFYVFARAIFSDEKLSECELLSKEESVKILFNRIDREYSEFTELIKNKFSEEELKFIILNFEDMPINFDKFGFSIQKNLRKLIYNILDVKQDDVILHPFCRKGELLVEGLEQYPENKIYGIDLQSDNILTSRLKAALISQNNEQVEIIQNNYLELNINKLGFNKVIAIPSFGLKFDDIEKITDEQNLIEVFKKNDFPDYTDWSQAIKATLTDSFEKAVFIFPNNALFNKKDIRVREYLVNEGLIETIIELPSKLLETTSIPINIVVLSKGNRKVKIIDASKIYTKNNRFNLISDDDLSEIFDLYKSTESQQLTFVDKEELSQNDFILSSKRYLSKEFNIKEFDYLKDLAEIKRGHANFRRKDQEARLTDQNTKYKILTSGDINEDFSIDELSNLEYLEDKELVYCLENNDIAFSRGGDNKSLIIQEDEQIIMANGSLYIISCDEEKINPYYLQLYLSSEHCKKQIEVLTNGSVISFIGVSELGELKIPRSQREIENDIAENYKIILQKYELLRIQRGKLKEEVLSLEEEVI